MHLITLEEWRLKDLLNNFPVKPTVINDEDVNGGDIVIRRSREVSHEWGLSANGWAQRFEKRWRMQGNSAEQGRGSLYNNVKQKKCSRVNWWWGQEWWKDARELSHNGRGGWDPQRALCLVLVQGRAFGGDWEDEGEKGLYFGWKSV